jgi:uncharacterized protein DUF1236
MEIAMRRLLLATTAAAALVAGTSLGLAQDSGKGGAPQPAPGGVHEKTPGGPAQGKGTSANPAQGKGAPGGMTQGERPNQPGARERRGERDGRVGQGERREEPGARGERGDRDHRVGQGERREQPGAREERGDRDGRVGQGERWEEPGVRGERGERSQAREGREGGRPAQLSADQRTRIHQSLFRGRAEVRRLDKVDFAVRVGVTVPRTVVFYDLPADIVEIVPAYRAYKYFLVGDEIVIVDPATYEIVDVIPA